MLKTIPVACDCGLIRKTFNKRREWKRKFINYELIEFLFEYMVGFPLMEVVLISKHETPASFNCL